MSIRNGTSWSGVSCSCAWKVEGKFRWVIPEFRSWSVIWARRSGGSPVFSGFSPGSQGRQNAKSPRYSFSVAAIDLVWLMS